MGRRTIVAAASLGLIGACTARSAGTGRASGAEAGGEGGEPAVRYGSDPSQFVELVMPSQASSPVPVAVIIHGGFWRAEYGIELARPLAATLPARGWAALSIEYRRVGNGGGYPQTLDDVAAAIDLLAGDEIASLAADAGVELDLDRVATVGHSAGGHLAVWAATRPGQSAGSPGASPRITLAAAVSQAGVLDLRDAARVNLGTGATQSFLGGSPDEVPENYDAASPIERVPLGVPVLCVHGERDDVVPIAQSEAFVAAATAAGDLAELLRLGGDHFVVIDPVDASWTSTLDWLERTV